MVSLPTWETWRSTRLERTFASIWSWQQQENRSPLLLGPRTWDQELVGCDKLTRASSFNQKDDISLSHTSCACNILLFVAKLIRKCHGTSINISYPPHAQYSEELFLIQTSQCPQGLMKMQSNALTRCNRMRQHLKQYELPRWLSLLSRECWSIWKGLDTKCAYIHQLQKGNLPIFSATRP